MEDADYKHTLVMAVTKEGYDGLDNLYKSRTGQNFAEYIKTHPETALQLFYRMTAQITKQGTELHDIFVEDDSGKLNRFNRIEDGDVPMQFVKDRQVDPLLTEIGVERDLVVIVSRPPGLRDILRGRWRQIHEEKARTSVKLTRAITPPDLNL